MTARATLRGAGGAQRRSFLARLVLLAVFFSAGVVLGQVLSAGVRGTAAPELLRYLKSFFSLSQERQLSPKAVLSALLIYLRYPLLAFVLGFASVGVVLLPLLTTAYGFFLSFSVCCFTAAFGRTGMLLALTVFGLRCLITLPCYFILAVPSLRSALSLFAASFGRGKRCLPTRYGADWWLRFGAVCGVLLFGTAAELFLVPQLLQLVLARILT